MTDAVDARHLDAAHQIVAAGQRVGSLGGGLDAPFGAALRGHHLPGDVGHALEPVGVDVDERDGAARAVRDVEKVVEDHRSEEAPRAQHGDLDRPGHVAGQPPPVQLTAHGPRNPPVVDRV